MTTLLHPQSKSGLSFSERWQQRLLPLMTRMLIGLTLFFFVASLTQLAFLHWRISAGMQPGAFSVPALRDLGPDATVDQRLIANNITVLTSIEVNVIERRYRNVTAFLISRLWLSYLGFVTGMILSLVGSVFVLGKLEQQ